LRWERDIGCSWKRLGEFDRLIWHRYSEGEARGAAKSAAPCYDRAPQLGDEARSAMTGGRRCKPHNALILAAGLAAVLFGDAPGAATSMTPTPLAVAPHVDLEKIYGGWYIVANIPNWFEAPLVGLYDIYSPRPDGDIEENFYTHSGSFMNPLKHYTVHDWVEPGSNNAKWRVQVFWPINFAFWILYVDPDDRYVLFGYPDRSLGWIYSRSQTIDETAYQSLLERFRALGYDSSKIRRIVQLPSQIGQKGFGGDAGEN
jgi:apolipoprotein D and lipocalin family protein